MARGFLPDTGPLLHLRQPTADDPAVIRVETGVRQGDAVSVYSDPMISKLVVHGRARREALRFLRNSLEQYQIVGPNTNIEFLTTVIEHPVFKAGEKYEADLFPASKPAAPHIIAQAALAIVLDPHSPWASLGGWRPNYRRTETITLYDGEDRPVTVEITPQSSDTFNIKISAKDGTTTEYDQAQASIDKDGALLASLGDQRFHTNIITQGDKLHVFDETGKRTLVMATPKYLSSLSNEAAGSVKTPMPCKISQVMVVPGQTVKMGTPLVVLEAMKMEHVIKSPQDGVIDRILFAAGDLAGENKLLVTFKAEETA
ncbi:biotin carboxylase C-terminal domain-containing protein [Syncephalis pseudoplumigaleata]|uniref:Biotin carboxylase C-terminal domain-containing protein n=1 Tax=Syncephalis pseudoplumigaleata TaxID=1712513 RepID=A0A4P9YR56_9FUNG|nr:biotin carboxylase C-terminal domain-containing protein [Syncephalis pseudoplumigaleata]|eukprot:RKP22343.1 biotin carboxylase C-terminal domain-containing protein [Syncephalis pseudoplumigaleata]